MREKLNENPKLQMALIGALLAIAALFFLMKGGGGESGEAATEPIETTVVSATEIDAATPVALPAPGTGKGAVPGPPKRIVAAFDAGETIALLFVHDGGIDDRLAARSVRRLSGLPGVATFVVPAKQVSSYISITQSVDLNRLPAFVVIRPKRLDQGPATASIQYGIQSPQNVVQAIVDAGYHGGDLAYHP